MEDDGEARNAGLHLGLGVGDQYIPKKQIKQKDKPVVCLDLPFTLLPANDQTLNINHKSSDIGSWLKTSNDEDEEDDGHRRSSYSHFDRDKNSNIGGERKKLRLTKEQSTFLEDSFKIHTTLNPAQKQALADQLKLKPRQVEVWFQNRRARTKLKQTEVDREFLKKCCESLSNENRRLKKELQELRSLKDINGPSPFFIHLQKAASTLTTCCSCDKILTAGGEC